VECAWLAPHRDTSAIGVKSPLTLLMSGADDAELRGAERRPVKIPALDRTKNVGNLRGSGALWTLRGESQTKAGRNE
jgi:hypothetical protein